MLESEYFARRASFFGSIHDHLDHIVFVDWLYLERLTGERLLPAEVGDLLHNKLAPLVEDQVAADRKLIDFCEAQTPDSLASKVTFQLSDGTRSPCRACFRIYSYTRFIIVDRCMTCSLRHRSLHPGRQCGSAHENAWYASP